MAGAEGGGGGGEGPVGAGRREALSRPSARVPPASPAAARRMVFRMGAFSLSASRGFWRSFCVFAVRPERCIDWSPNGTRGEAPEF